jgi:hypothetical protein
MRRTYSELIQLETFLERFNYLKLNGSVGEETFGYARYLNQQLYHSLQWKKVKREVIIRDEGCDLAIQDRQIRDRIYIHHLNPITEQDIINNSKKIFDLENLVCVSKATHDAIHYGDQNLLIPSEPIVRTKNDTCPWRC